MEIIDKKFTPKKKLFCVYLKKSEKMNKEKKK